MKGRSSLSAMTGALWPLTPPFLYRCCAARVVVALIATMVIVLGCRPDPDSRSADASVETSSPADITVTADRSNLVFTYQDPKSGEFATATSRDEVPNEARQAVVVTDLRLSPAERQAGRYVYVTDLRTAREDGTFPVAVASRYGFEARLTATSTASGSDRQGVVVYSASWCGVCKKTKRLLKAWNVPFVEKDVEASRSAQQELAAKAAQAGIRPGGVPVIDVAGILLQGLDERQLRDALQRTGLL